jgi:hypothetical protein
MCGGASSGGQTGFTGGTRGFSGGHRLLSGETTKFSGETGPFTGERVTEYKNMYRKTQISPLN